MRTSALMAILLSLVFSTTSKAEIVYCENECFKLKDDHLATIKGLLYEITEQQDKKTNKTFLPLVAETIVWMENKHKEDKSYKLKDFKKDDRARLVNSAIGFIVDVVSGKTVHNAENTLARLTITGYKVLAEYKEKIVDKKTVVEYKLRLKEVESKK
tara:strand:- start:1058 stop:1528 length:471 start_codon:yes stop_codon:yes gene_type:complete